MAGQYQGLGPITRGDILAGQWAIVQRQIDSNRKKAARMRGYRAATTTTTKETTS